jgi:hypothetical protein
LFNKINIDSLGIYDAFASFHIFKDSTLNEPAAIYNFADAEVSIFCSFI